jgi:hypothetical protein
MLPQHYSRDIVKRCHTLLGRLLPLIERGHPDDRKFGGPLSTTFMLAMATPMIVLPLERIHKPATRRGQVGDDREVDVALAQEVAAVLGGDRRFGDSPFGSGGSWSYIPTYNPHFNLANPLPQELVERLASREAAERAKTAPTAVILNVLRNGLAHGGVAYLNGDGRTSDGVAAMFAFVSTARDDRRRIIGLDVLRIGQADFLSFLTKWAEWLEPSEISRALSEAAAID